MTYDLKWAEETGWAALVAAVVYAAGVLGAGMPTDHWQLWLFMLAGGMARTVVATVISRSGPVAKLIGSIKSKPATSANLSVVTVPVAEYTTTGPSTHVAPTSISWTYSPDLATGLVAQTPPDKVLANTLPDHTGTLPRLQASSPPDPLS